VKNTKRASFTFLPHFHSAYHIQTADRLIYPEGHCNKWPLGGWGWQAVSEYLFRCHDQCVRSDPECLRWYGLCDRWYPNDQKGKKACYDTCWEICMEKCQDKLAYLADLLEDADYEGF